MTSPSARRGGRACNFMNEECTHHKQHINLFGGEADAEPPKEKRKGRAIYTAEMKEYGAPAPSICVRNLVTQDTRGPRNPSESTVDDGLSSIPSRSKSSNVPSGYSSRCSSVSDDVAIQKYSTAFASPKKRHELPRESSESSQASGSLYGKGADESFHSDTASTNGSASIRVRNWVDERETAPVRTDPRARDHLDIPTLHRRARPNVDGRLVEMANGRLVPKYSHEYQNINLFSDGTEPKPKPKSLDRSFLSEADAYRSLPSSASASPSNQNSPGWRGHTPDHSASSPGSSSKGSAGGLTPQSGARKLTAMHQSINLFSHEDAAPPAKIVNHQFTKSWRTTRSGYKS